MGTFYLDCIIENHADPKRSTLVPQLLVDTGSEHTGVPASVLESLGVVRQKKDLSFRMANGQTITRSIGFAVVRSGEFFTIDEVVFGEPGDMSLLGARSLQGFNARVDAYQKKLVAAGPMVAAEVKQS